MTKIKHAVYDPDTDNDGMREYPSLTRRVEPGDLVIGPAATYVPAAGLPHFTGYVDQFGAPWVDE